MSSAHACRAGFSACCAGTQLESFRATGLSWAWTRPAASVRAAATAASGNRLRIVVVSWNPFKRTLLCISKLEARPSWFSLRQRLAVRRVFRLADLQFGFLAGGQ